MHPPRSEVPRLPWLGLGSPPKCAKPHAVIESRYQEYQYHTILNTEGRGVHLSVTLASFECARFGDHICLLSCDSRPIPFEQSSKKNSMAVWHKYLMRPTRSARFSCG
ncbi:unnamed protein product [Ectocarpus sp. 13 AM-2016]